MSLLTGAARLIGGVLVEIDDPALPVEDAAGRVKFVFEDRLGLVWPEATAKLSYALAPNTVGQTRWIAVYGLDAGSDIARQMCEGKGNDAFIDMLDRVCSAAEQLLKRPPGVDPAPSPIPMNGAHIGGGDWEKPAEPTRD